MNRPCTLLVVTVAACAGQSPDDTGTPLIDPGNVSEAEASTPSTSAEPTTAQEVGPPVSIASVDTETASDQLTALKRRVREVLAAIADAESSRERPYRWFTGPAHELLVQRFTPPSQFARIAAEPGTFGDWLRHVPLKPAGAPVYLHTGELKSPQSVHAAVIDMDVGARDLQQCADAVIRLRAEYLYTAGRERDICFRSVQGKKLRWRGSGFNSFRKYLDRVFGRANSASLMREMREVPEGAPIEIGDALMEPAAGGRYGHAVMVMDAAENAAGERVFLLSQSYMPAQESHILKNFNDPSLSPWFRIDQSVETETPEWRFPIGSLRRFAQQGCPR